MIPPEDPIWPEFRPLWAGFQATGGRLLVGGGYGLFLKQHWLSAQRDIPTIVQLAQWRDTAPRVTRDLDIVVGLDIISDSAAQKQIAGTLTQLGFRETAKHPRWQFEKSLSLDRTMIVDFHACPPTSEYLNLRLDNIRIKHKPSLGDQGIHGRQNPEAVGYDLHAFLFEMDGVQIAVPNPVTWNIMKLTAMRDQWRKAESPNESERDREFYRNQAIKHARDVCRITAMVTRDERDGSAEIVEAVHATPAFADAANIFKESLANDGWGVRFVADQWEEQDFQLLQGTLASWFR